MRWKIPREVVVGFLAIVTIALLVWGIDFLKQSNLFSEKNNYFIVYNEIDGLVESGEVVLNGLKIGNVSKITYDQKSKGILVEINLEDNYRLPKFTRAEIFSADLMGTKAIRLDFGLGKEGYHPVGDYLLPSREPSLQDKVGQEMLPVKIKAEELMMEMQRVLEIVKYIFNENTRENLSKSFESIKITLNNLENSSVSLDTLLGQGSGKIQRILSNIESISSNLRDNNDKLANIITNFDNISDSLAKSEITSTINNADLALKQANSILNKIHRGEGTIGMLINNDTLYNNLENAAHNLDELLVDLKENPKRYIHYSLFDFGRTFYVAKDEANAIQMKEGSEELEKFSKELKKHEASPSRVSDKDLKRIDQKIELFESKPDKYPANKVKEIKERVLDLKATIAFGGYRRTPQVVVFKVQVKSSKRKIKEKREFKGYENIEELELDGRYKYAIGSFHDLENAISTQEKIRQDFPDAFVIAIKGQNQITIKEAKSLLDI